MPRVQERVWVFRAACTALGRGAPSGKFSKQLSFRHLQKKVASLASIVENTYVMMKKKLSLRSLLFLLMLPVAVFAWGCAEDDDLGDSLEDAGDEMQDAAEDAADGVEDTVD